MRVVGKSVADFLKMGREKLYITYTAVEILTENVG